MKPSRRPRFSSRNVRQISVLLLSLVAVAASPLPGYADCDLNYAESFGPEGSDPGELWGPGQIEQGPDNYLWVVDFYNRRISVFDTSGNFQFVWNPSVPSGWNMTPWDIAFVSSEGIWHVLVGFLNDTAGQTGAIGVYTISGRALVNWFVPEWAVPPALFTPTGLEVDDQGILYAPSSSRGIFRYEVTGSGTSFDLEEIGSPIKPPCCHWIRDIVVAPDGSIFARALSSSYVEELLKLDTEGTILASYSPLDVQSRFVAVDADGTVYAGAIVDSHVVLKFDDNLAVTDSIPIPIPYPLYAGGLAYTTQGVFITSRYVNRYHFDPGSPPVAACQNIEVWTPENQCSVAVDPGMFDAGSYDPEGYPLIFSASPPGPYYVGVTPVTVTVRDCGNATATCGATVTVREDDAPWIDNCASSVEIGTAGSLAVQRTDPRLDEFFSQTTAGDLCGSPVITNDAPDLFPSMRTTLVTFTATDWSGNHTSCGAYVTVRDTLYSMADPGEDRIVGAGGSVALDGSESLDSQGGNYITLFQWSVPPNEPPNDAPYIVWTGPTNQAQTSFTAPRLVQSVRVRLYVEDGYGFSDTEDIIVTVVENADANASVFVSPSFGVDTQPGTYTRPVATIGRALQVAGGRTPRADIYLHQGTYSTGGITVLDGMSVYGGFATPTLLPSGDLGVWMRPQTGYAALHPTRIVGTSGTTVCVAIDDIATATTVDGLEIRSMSGADGTAGERGQNSIAVRVTDSNEQLRISNNRIFAAEGGDGASGTSGVDGHLGSPGQPGDDGADLLDLIIFDEGGRGDGGLGGLSPDGGTGGDGGDGGLSLLANEITGDFIQSLWDTGGGEGDVLSLSGIRGKDGVSGTRGGAGGHTRLAFKPFADFPIQLVGEDGSDGQSGTPGVNGQGGTGGSGLGTFLRGDWQGTPGLDGVPGTRANGGGGGGGGGSHIRLDCLIKVWGMCVQPFSIPLYRPVVIVGGAGSGGGGAGGHATAGRGGSAGGGSVGIFVENSAPVVTGNEITVASGGTGGRGGRGGLGASGGGSAEPGHTVDENAGDGGISGYAGKGGSGGGGGGGVGGCSCGILQAPNSNVLASANTVAGGAGGIGGAGGYGQGGTSGTAGANGLTGTFCNGPAPVAPSPPVIVTPGVLTERPATIAAGLQRARIGISFPGSDVELSLRSPSGRIIDRSTTDPDVLHIKGETHEFYEVDNPESGEWTVRLFGLEVPLEGEETSIALTEIPANISPFADAGIDQIIEAICADSTEATLSASGSSDPDGDILAYLWRDALGDTVGTEPVARTTLPLGTHTFRVAVHDFKGGASEDSATVSIVDTTPPEISLSSRRIYAATDAESTTVELTGVASATDLCDSELLIAYVPPSGSYFPMGTTKVVCTATDDFNNVSIDSLLVVVTPTQLTVSGHLAGLDETTSSSLLLADRLIEARDLTGAVVGWTYTNAEGAYSIGNLPPHGTYELRVSAPPLYTDGVITNIGLDQADAELNLLLVKPGWTDKSDPAFSDPQNGMAAAWGDYDGDGDQDLYLANDAEANHLYRNDGSGNLVDVTSPPLDNDREARAAAWGDYNKDGALDLYLANYTHGDRLFKNTGNGSFVDATPAELYTGGDNPAVSWVDYNNDGALDLSVATHDLRTWLFKNDGHGNLSRVSGTILDQYTAAVAMAWADYDNDGDQDLYLVNEGQDNRLLRNDPGTGGARTFVNVTTPTLANPTGLGGGVDWGDYDNDGDLDLYVANSNESNRLFRNDGGGLFTDVTDDATANMRECTGVAWGDYNNDGFLDLYLCNNGSGNRLLAALPDSGRFVDATSGSLIGDTGPGTGNAWADIDGDGDLDLFFANNGAPSKLLRNDHQPGNHWLRVDLVGTASNRSGIGARVRVVSGGRSQSREVSGGSGYGSQNSLTAEFGLGSASTVDSVIVRWPYGNVQSLAGLACDQRITITDDANALPISEPGGPYDRGCADPYLFVATSHNTDTDNDIVLRYCGANGVLGTPVNVSVAGTPWTLMTTDFNRDRLADLAVVTRSGSANTITIVYGKPEDGFHNYQNVDMGTDESFATATDLDGDQYPDLIATLTRSGDDRVSVRRARGDGTFATSMEYRVGPEAVMIAVGYLNNDTNPDLVVPDASTSGGMAILLGTGGGGFPGTPSYAGSPEGTWVAIGDLDGDGDADLAEVRRNYNDVKVLLGNGNGTFGTPTTYTTGNDPRWVGIGRIDGDARPDLVVCNRGSSTVAVYKNNGNGTFAPPVSYPAGSSLRSGALADLNGDGYLDVVVTSDVGTVSVLLGIGDGTFSPATAYAMELYPYSVVVGQSYGPVVTFDGSASYDPNDSIVSYAWDFGDSTFASGAVASHMYSGPGEYAARLCVEDTFGCVSCREVSVTISGPCVTDVEDEQELPKQLALGGARPNPFDESVKIDFALPAPGKATLRIYDITGRAVRTLVDGSHPAGYHTVVWDGRDAAGRRTSSGVYLYRLSFGDQILTNRVVRIR